VRSVTTLLIGLASVVALGGCGGSDAVTTSTTDAPTMTEAPSAVQSSTSGAPESASQSPVGSATTTAVASPSGDDATLPSSTASPTLSIDIEAYEWRFQPDIWSVAAGEELTIEFANRGGTEHDWTLLALGQTITKLSEFDDDMVLFKVEEVPSGDAVTRTLTIDEPGTYQVICTLSGHFNTGMGGSLTVR